MTIDLSTYKPRAIALDKLLDSTLNHRRIFRGIEELSQSILAAGGIEVPLVARPARDKGTFEIVCGHRRKRGAALAGLVELPVIVRDLSDLEALELQARENQDREDFTPLEEAELYWSFVDKHGFTIERVAERVARSKAYVGRRLKLLSLIPAARDAVEIGADAKGGMELGAAEALSCYPETVQSAALPHLIRTDTIPAMLGARAREFLAEKFTLRLAKPPFDPTDAFLVAAAGACGGCPKRTGNQGELFADMSEDTCTDPTCFDAKSAASWGRKVEEYAAKGYRVLEEDDIKEIFGGFSSVPISQKWVNLDERVRVGDAEKTYRQILGGKATLKNATVCVARNPKTGQVFELLEAKAAAEIAEERKEKGALETIPPRIEALTPSAKAEQKQAKRQERENKHVAGHLIEVAVGGVSKLKKLDDELWRLIAAGIVSFAPSDVQFAVAKRRELVETTTRADVDHALQAHVEQLPTAGCIGLLLEIVLTRGLLGAESIEVKKNSPLGKAVEFVGLDWSVTVRDAKQSVKEEPAEQRLVKVERKKKPAPAKKGDGACRVCKCTDLEPCKGETDSDVCTWVLRPEDNDGEGLCSRCHDAGDAQ